METVSKLRAARPTNGDSWLESNLDYPDLEVVIFSDALGMGGAAFKDPDPLSHLVMPNQSAGREQLVDSDIFIMTWSAMEAEQSSTWRDIKVVDKGLKAFSRQLQGCLALWYTNNLGGVRSSLKRLMKTVLNPIAESIEKTCKTNGFRLGMRWFRRNENQLVNCR